MSNNTVGDLLKSILSNQFMVFKSSSSLPVSSSTPVEDNKIASLTKKSYVITERLASASSNRVFVSGNKKWQIEMQHISTTIKDRIQWYVRLLKCMLESSDFVHAKTTRDLASFLRRESVLGEGTYAQVVRFFWKTLECSPIPIVGKIEKPDQYADKDAVELESVCDTFANTLVLNQISPHFQLLLGRIVIRDPTMNEYNKIHRTHYPEFRTVTFFEHATDSLYKLVYNRSLLARQRRTVSWYLSAYFQVLTACLFMAQYYGMVHNDLYMRNLLYNDIDPAHYEYHVHFLNGQHVTYRLNTHGTCIKVGDFGFCGVEVQSSLNILPSELKPITSATDLTKPRVYATEAHVTNWIMGKYARDIVSLTLSFADAAENDKNPVYSYFDHVYQYVIKQILDSSLYLDTIQQLEQLFRDIVSLKMIPENLKAHVPWIIL